MDESMDHTHSHTICFILNLTNVNAHKIMHKLYSIDVKIHKPTEMGWSILPCWELTKLAYTHWKKG